MNRRTMPVPAALTTLLVVGVAAGALAGCEVRIGSREARGDEVSETRDVTAVTAVELRTSGVLNLAVGDEPGLSVTGRADVLDDLVTRVDGDTLVIDLEDSWRNTGYLEFNLVVPALSSVLLSGSGEVYGELGAQDAVNLEIDGSGEIGVDDLSADDVRLAIHGSGDIRVEQVTTTSLDVVVDGSGDVEVAGETDHVRVAIPGSGNVDAAELTARTGDVTIDGSGETTVSVSDTLDAAIEGSGDITYLGDPEVHQEIDGSGDITQG